MSTLNYVVLQDSTGWNKRFRVPQGTLGRKSGKMQTRDRTVTGRADTQEGPHVVTYEFQVRVLNVPTGTDPDGATYGVLADIRQLFNYLNPRGTPSTQINFVDHLGASHTVELTGELAEENITPYLDGKQAWYYLPLTLEEVG